MYSAMHICTDQPISQATPFSISSSNASATSSESSDSEDGEPSLDAEPERTGEFCGASNHCQGSGLLLERIQSMLLVLPEEGLHWASHMGLERKCMEVLCSEWHKQAGILGACLCLPNSLNNLQDKPHRPPHFAHQTKIPNVSRELLHAYCRQGELLGKALCTILCNRLCLQTFQVKHWGPAIIRYVYTFRVAYLGAGSKQQNLRGST